MGAIFARILVLPPMVVMVVMPAVAWQGRFVLRGCRLKLNLSATSYLLYRRKQSYEQTYEQKEYSKEDIIIRDLLLYNLCWIIR
ncbi:MAG: hypothetical protein NVSMB27_23560 [Ktedonobacteraceae bacterium]